MKQRLQFLLPLFIAMRGIDSSAATITVPGNAATIQAGINLAVAGDTVLVSDGNYAENINFMGKAITVTSANGPAVTTINGSATAAVVTFGTSETNASVLSGFTIRNGKSSQGGGVSILGSSPIIRGNIITANVSTSGGGGVYSTGGAARIEDNTITANQASSGNGIELAFSNAMVSGNTITLNTRGPGSGGTGGGGVMIRGAGSAQIVGNLIAQNTTGTDGGGISMFAAGTPTIRDNTIRNNQSSSGGGISHTNSSDSLIVQNLIYGNTATTGGGIEWLVPGGARGPRVVNNTIAMNTATSGSALFADGFDVNSELYNNILIASPGQTAVLVGNFNDQNAPKFFNNDLFSAGGAAYSGIGINPVGSSGNVSFDALFVNAAGGDYRLLAASPLVDVGTNSAPDLPPLDFAGRTRIFDGNANGLAVVDIGAHELVPEPSSGALIALGLVALAALRRR